jgi:DNA ligase-1
MNSPADVIELIAATNSRNEKEAILQQAWDEGQLEFFTGVKMALDNMITFGVQKVPLIEEDDGTEGDFCWADFQMLADNLSSRKLTGNAARDAIHDAALVANAREWNLWYRRLLLKDLKCGLTETTINKVLDANGKSGKLYKVPVFSCQLAKPADDNPKKMVGEKLLDRKYDGVRLLTVVTRSGDVRQFTRNGLENTNFGHICDMLKGLSKVLTEDVVLDGEVISHNFQALMKQVNRKDDVNTKDSRLMLFDIIPLKAFRAGEYNVAQADRHNALCELIPQFQQLTDGVVSVEPKLKVNLSTDAGRKAMSEFNRQVLEEGLEGVMVKDPTASYKTKRTDGWLKIKPFQTYDLTIVAVEEGQGKFEGTLGAIVCEGEDNGKQIRVNVGSGYSEELRDQIWKAGKQVLGRVVEIKGDALTMDQNQHTWSLRFPVFLQFRGWNPGEKI